MKVNVQYIKIRQIGFIRQTINVKEKDKYRHIIFNLINKILQILNVLINM